MGRRGVNPAAELFRIKSYALMKLLLLLALLGFFTIDATAQLTAGTHFFNTTNGPDGAAQSGGFAGGQLVFDDGVYFQLLGTPNYGRFLSDHFLLGGSASLGIFNFSSTTSTLVGLGLFGRYYFNPAAVNNHFFAQLSSSISVVDLSDADIFVGLQLGGGWNRFITPDLALELSLAYVNDDIGSPSNGGDLQLGAGINVFLSPNAWQNREPATAGFGRGSLMVGGTSAGLSVDPGQTGATSINLSPNVAYFLSDRFALGANVAFNYFRGHSDANPETIRVGIGPVARYYLGAIDNRVWFVYGGFDWEYTAFSSSFGSNNYDSFNTYAGAGLNLFVTPNIALELGPGLYYSPEFRALSLQLRVGAQFFLNGSQMGVPNRKHLD